MRKHVKEHIDSILAMLNDAHNEICKCLENNELNDALDILTACQEGAISIGMSIEESEGEGTREVALLEEYCELLYRIAMTIQDNYVGVSQNNIRKQIKKLSVQIAKVSSFINDIKIKKEIVFLPYKASMWDSLESVWMVADKDEMCDAYVVPIPYYDKNPDGSFGQMHYEGDQYPKDVPVTYYNDYSIENRRPDVIYIHNPYDEYNKVTSVAPQFYSKHIKKYTDELVYIPYFVSGDSVPEHFCVLPGTIYADKVIVENEKVREIYVREYEKAFNQTGLGDKFLALGSPKYDRVTRLKKEDFSLPDEWVKKIEGKKVILYNTSVQNIIKEPEKMIKKINNTINIMKKHEKVVLWWRPHPLTIATLGSMKPAYHDEYIKLVEEYRNLNVGIYDDTSDLDRAIVYSDAYYGDGGSVLSLYKITKKPIMLQNLDILN